MGSAQAITADSLLTGVLIVTLHWSRTGIKRTDSMIDVLILYAVSTGERLSRRYRSGRVFLTRKQDS